jgi:serine/threonine protein kinase
MAPEHLLGQEASVASDLYSLGATLFELCSGELPHDDQSLSALIQGAMAGPPPLVAPGHLEPIPGIFTQLVASLLSPEPTARPATAHQVAASARAIQKETRKRTARARSAWDDFAALASSGKWETQPPPAPRPSIEAASIRSRGSWSRPPAHTLAPPGSEAPGTGKSRGVA